MESTDVERILDVAAQLFADNGYDGTGIREIATLSGTPAPSIYYHFKSKQELYREASARKYEEAYEKVEFAIDNCHEPAAKLEALVSTLFDLFIDDRVLFLLMQRDIVDSAVLRARSVMKGHYQKNLGLLERLLTETAGHAVDQRAVFTIASLILGYCELSTITDGVANHQDKHWYMQQKQHLCQQVQLLCANIAST